MESPATPGRFIPLRWSAHIGSVAVSGTDATLGHVEVKLNGQAVNNLYLVTIDLGNETSQDLSDVELQVGFRDGTVFLSGGGGVQGSLRSVPFAEDFAQTVAQYLALPPDQQTEAALQQLSTNRIFRIPVLNRGDMANFAFLVDAPHGIYPELQVSTQHRGVKLRRLPPKPQVFGVRQDLAGWTGLAVGLAAMVALATTQGVGLGLILLAVLVGSFGQLLGATIIRAWRLVIRLLS